MHSILSWQFTHSLSHTHTYTRTCKQRLNNLNCRFNLCTIKHYTYHFLQKTLLLHMEHNHRSTVCFASSTFGQVHMFLSSCKQLPLKDKTGSVWHDLLHWELDIQLKFDLTISLLLLPTRSFRTLIVPFGKYSPIVFMLVPCLDSVIFQYKISYPKLGSPLESKNICVVFTMKLTFLISVRSCEDKNTQNYIELKTRNGYTEQLLKQQIIQQ